MRARTLGLLGVAGAATAGAALGFLGERAVVRRPDLSADPEAVALATPVPGETHVVRAEDGTRLHVVVSGPEGAPTIVCSHGYGLGRDLWHLQRRDLSDAFRVVVYDQRGHGSSATAATGDWSIEALGSDLRAVFEATVPASERAVIVGHSMGGMAAMALARDHRDLLTERVAGVVLVSTAAGHLLTSAGPPVLTALVQASVSRAFTSGAAGQGMRRRAVDRSVSNDLSFLSTRAVALNADAAPAHVAFIEQLLLACPGPVKRALGPTVTNVDMWDGVDAMDVPAVVIVGDADRLTPERQAHRLVERLAQGRLIVLPGVGHSPMLEAGDELTAHIRDFATEVTGAAAAHPAHTHSG